MHDSSRAAKALCVPSVTSPSVAVRSCTVARRARPQSISPSNEVAATGREGERERDTQRGPARKGAIWSKAALP